LTTNPATALLVCHGPRARWLSTPFKELHTPFVKLREP
jgi:hypothetical protein